MRDDGLADSVFTHDPSLMTDHGAVILSMGKALRTSGAGAARGRLCAAWAFRCSAASRRPAPSRAATASGSTRTTLAIGRGVRTNQEGIRQVADLLAPIGIEVHGFDLPLWQGEEACLHLMSVISPLADDLALVYSPLLPAAFYQMLKARGITLVEGDADEFHASARPQPQRAADRAARGHRGRRLPEDAGRDGSGRLHGRDLRGRCAVHRLRGRADLPDAPDPEASHAAPAC